MLLQLGEFVPAQRDYSACLELHPDNPTALYKRALLHFNQRLDHHTFTDIFCQ